MDQKERIPHQHLYKRQEIALTSEMTLTDFSDVA
jgi:hypothetical protein